MKKKPLKRWVFQVSFPLEVEQVESKKVDSNKVLLSVKQAIEDALLRGEQNGFTHPMECDLSILAGEVKVKAEFEGEVQ